jgi:hypothetical protein
MAEVRPRAIRTSLLRPRNTFWRQLGNICPDFLRKSEYVAILARQSRNTTGRDEWMHSPRGFRAGLFSK